MQPANGLLLVRPVETDETRAGGRVLLIAETRERMTANQCECLTRGGDAECDDEDCERAHAYDANSVRRHPCPVNPGDWLLVRPRSYIAGPYPEKSEWFIAQDDVLAILSED